jgi:hypothetical protein
VNWLANAGADALVSGDWVLKLIGAIFTGAALILGRYWGKKEAGEMTIKDPVPTVPMSKVTTPPSWDAHRALCDRVSRLEEDMRSMSKDVKAIKDSQADQFQKLMVAGAEREIRISEKIEGFARAIHTRIDEYLKPTTPARRS